MPKLTQTHTEATPEPPRAPRAARFAEAVALHQAGQIDEANIRYEALFAEEPSANDLRHNLGLTRLALGRLAPGLALVAAALEAEPGHPGMRATPRLVGSLLFERGYWEAARPWLLRAVQHAPDDLALAQLLARLAPRDYLAPEVFSPLENTTLLRSTPREAETYVYTLDIASSCNLRCPSCPVGNFAGAERPRKFMSLDLFQRILAKIAAESPVAAPQIWLYNWGEPLLHADLPAMVRAVRERGFCCHLSSNLNVESGLKELIKSDPSELKVSLSGFTPESYALSHAKGDLMLVKSNLYRLRKYLDHYQASTRVWVGHHLYRHNHAQRPEVERLCAELGFGYQPTQAFYQPLEKLMALVEGDARVAAEPILDQLLVRPEAQAAFLRAHRQPGYDCELRYNQTVIDADGGVALCCNLYDGNNRLGMAFLDHPHAAIEARKYAQPLCVKCRALGLDYAPKALPQSLTPDA